MDPDEALRRLRAAIEALKVAMRDGASCDYDLGETADEVIVKFEVLDGWLSRGGFVPKAWSKDG